MADLDPVRSSHASGLKTHAKSVSVTSNGMDWTKIWARTPEFRDLYKKYGEGFAIDYYEQTDFYNCPVSFERKKEFLDVFGAIVISYLGEGIRSRAVADLEKTWTVGTADHAGVLTHPFFLSNSLLMSLVAKKKGRSTFVILPTASISLSNGSYPRGYLGRDDNGDTKRQPILARRNTPVYSALLGDGKLFRSILPKLNYDFWKKAFPFLPEIVSIDLESLCVELLLKHINTGSVLDKMFCTLPLAPLRRRREEPNKGTYLFWKVSNNGREKLSAEDFKNIDIVAGLKDGSLMPNMFLCFSVISFYYGIRCGGGFLQIHYLKEMRDTYEQAIAQLGYNDEVSMVQKVPTDLFRGEFSVLNKDYNGEILPMMGLDLVKNTLSEKDISDLQKKYLFKDCLDFMYGEFKRIVG